MPSPHCTRHVPLNRLVGEVEDFVAECDAEDAKAQHDKNETEQNGMVELLRPEIVDVQGKQREYKRIEQAKCFVGKRVVAVTFCGLATKTKTSVMIGAGKNAYTPRTVAGGAPFAREEREARSNRKHTTPTIPNSSMLSATISNTSPMNRASARSMAR